jgi:response regulator NasT
MSRSLRIAVAEDERDTREFLQELLTRRGHQVATATTGRELVELCRAAEPDVVLTDIRMPDMDGLAAEEINRHRAVPVILISAYHDAATRERALADHVMAYLVKPIREAELEAALPLAVLRFEHFQALRKEAADLRQALEDRKVIERAKGAVVRRLRVDEAEAFRRLRKLASDHNRRLIEVAQQVLEGEAVFAALDGC